MFVGIWVCWTSRTILSGVPLGAFFQLERWESFQFTSRHLKCQWRSRDRFCQLKSWQTALSHHFQSKWIPHVEAWRWHHCPLCFRVAFGTSPGHKYCAEPGRLVAFANAVLCNQRFKDEVQQFAGRSQDMPKKLRSMDPQRNKWRKGGWNSIQFTWGAYVFVFVFFFSCLRQENRQTVGLALLSGPCLVNLDFLCIASAWATPTPRAGLCQYHCPFGWAQFAGDVHIHGSDPSQVAIFLGRKWVAAKLFPLSIPKGPGVGADRLAIGLAVPIGVPWVATQRGVDGGSWNKYILRSHKTWMPWMVFCLFFLPISWLFHVFILGLFWMSFSLGQVLYPDKHLLPLLYEAVLSPTTPLTTRHMLLDLCRTGVLWWWGLLNYLGISNQVYFCFSCWHWPSRGIGSCASQII